MPAGGETAVCREDSDRGGITHYLSFMDTRLFFKSGWS